MKPKKALKILLILTPTIIGYLKIVDMIISTNVIDSWWWGMPVMVVGLILIAVFGNFLDDKIEE